MQSGFTTTPRAEDMVTEDCSLLPYPTSLPHYNCKDLLCVTCGWEGHAHFPDAPWPVFQTHKCKLRTFAVSLGD